MYLTSAFILGALALYLLFRLLDSRFLPELKGNATVTAKHHVPAGNTYRTQVIGNQNLVLPIPQGEGWLAYLEIEGRPAGIALDKARFDSLSVGDRVEVAYRKRRFTGGIDVLRVMDGGK
jgi:hypothetical protein